MCYNCKKLFIFASRYAKTCTGNRFVEHCKTHTCSFASEDIKTSTESVCLQRKSATFRRQVHQNLHRNLPFEKHMQRHDLSQMNMPKPARDVFSVHKKKQSTNLLACISAAGCICLTKRTAKAVKDRFPLIKTALQK